MSDSRSPSLVSSAQLYDWRQRTLEIAEEIKTLSAERDMLDRLIGMAEALIAEARLLEAATDTGTAHSRFLTRTLDGLCESDNFPTALALLVERAEDGITYEQMKEAILLSPLATRFKKSDKGFYHAIRRGRDSGNFVEYRSYLFTPSNLKVFQAKVAAGLKQDKSRPVTTGSPMMDLVLEVVATNPGIIAKDVISKLQTIGPTRGIAIGSEGSAFNAIKRLKDREQIEGYGNLERQLRLGAKAPEEMKRLASSGNVIPLAKRTEAPSGLAAGASESGRGGNPDLFSPPAATRR